jgi:hypothetical protein
LSRVIDATSAKGLWEKLQKLYGSTDASIIVAIEDEIYRFKCSRRSMEEHFNDFRLLIQREKSAGGEMSATSVTLATLRTCSDFSELNQLGRCDDSLNQ